MSGSAQNDDAVRLAEAAGDPRDASVVVLAWEDHEMTQRCLASLSGQAAQVILVDNGSHEPHKSMLAQIAEKCGAELVRSEYNLGFAGGMNLGLARARKSVVVFSNNDLTVMPGTIAKLVDALELPSVGAAFPSTLDSDGQVTTAGGSFLTIWRALAHAIGLNLLVPRFRIVASPNRCDWLTGPFVAMPTSLAHKIGGVPSQSFFYAEDYRICWTIRQLGLAKKLVSDAAVIHMDDASAKKVWDEAGIAQNQTRELLRAAVDQYRFRWTRGLLVRSYLFGCMWRYRVKPSPVRRGCVLGAREALR